MYAFPKQQRLRKRSEFTPVLKNGIKVAHPDMVMLAKPNGAEQARIGFIVSRKVGNAVVRNRVKRHLRECFRTTAEKPVGIDLVVIARFPLAEASHQQVELSFQKCLSRLIRKMQHSESKC